MGKIAKFFLASPENNYHPPVLSFKAFLIYGTILLLLRLFLGTLPAKSAAVDSTALMRLINQERSNRNLPVLYAHQSLTQAAREKSQDMIQRDYFAHIDPDGNYVWGRIVAAGYSPYKILGENLAVDFATSEGMIKAWIDSPTHRANLLHPDFVDQGLAALFGDYQGRYTNLTASLFGTLASALKRSPAVKAEPSPPAPPPSPSKEASPPLPESPPETFSSPAKPRESLPLPERPQRPPVEIPKPELAASLNSALYLSRVVFTLFGAMLLVILSIDSVIIYRRELLVSRSHPTYHLFGFILIVLISILIWWW